MMTNKEIYNLHTSHDSEPSELYEAYQDVPLDSLDESRKNNTPLHTACHFADMTAVGILLDRGADPNVKNDDGDTPLCVMARRGPRPDDAGIAGLLLSAVISDTVLFRSPTCTQQDRETAEKLAAIAGVDLQAYGMDMLKAGANVSDLTPDQIAQNDMKELAIVVKADVQGSAEAVKQSLEKLSNEEVRVRVIHAGVGAISKSDVDLADASNAIIIGFNVRPDNIAKEEAAATKVEMRMYRVIYDAINDVSDAMKGMLAPKFREVSLGELQVRQVYKISSVGTVAGCRVISGKITRDSKIRVVRDGIVIAEDEIASLRRFKDDVKEVADGYECGVTLEKFSDVKEGDVYEAFRMEEYRD